MLTIFNLDNVFHVHTLFLCISIDENTGHSLTRCQGSQAFGQESNIDYLVDYGPPSMLRVQGAILHHSSGELLVDLQEQETSFDVKIVTNPDSTDNINEKELCCNKTKSTQTCVNSTVCCRCSLVVNSRETFDECNHDKRMYSKNSESGECLIFSNQNFTPSEDQRRQLEILANEACMVTGPKNLPEKTSGNIRENITKSTYQDIFKEIFMILHTAHN